MILLETEFKSSSGGFGNSPQKYTQLKRTTKTDGTKNAAVYSVTGPNGRIRGYEVFAIGIIKKGTPNFDKVYEDDTEIYPGSSAFGRTPAWFVVTLERAQQRFDELVEKFKA